MWVREGDYLLGERDVSSVDFVLGNPPYIRLEDVPADRMAAYRAACPTMTGRSDVYVGFFEVGLRSLGPGGVLGFICADRWMRNQYGRYLRQLVADHYSVDATITMHDVDAFTNRCQLILRSRYCGGRSKARLWWPIQVAASVPMTPERWWPGPGGGRPNLSWPHGTRSLGSPIGSTGGDSWPTGSPAGLALIEDLNDRFPLLEDPDTSTRVGIGVATGADGRLYYRLPVVRRTRCALSSDGRGQPSRSTSWSSVQGTTWSIALDRNDG